MVTTTRASVTSDQFLEQCSKEYEQTQSELKEMDLLIQQTTAEVERLAQRNTQVTNKLRQIEATLDTVPREDIREAYTAVLDTQQRLFTMRGQLEKQQSRQRDLTHQLDLLHDMLEVTGWAGFGSQIVGEEADGEAEEGQPAKPLVVRIIEAQERERQRLSRQMHDGPAQALTNLILQAEICERLFDTDADRARGELVNLKTAVAGTFQKVKGFILNLRPMMLDDLGVVPTLRRYVDSLAENSDVVTNLTFTGKERRLEPHKEVTIFRLTQELLNNAIEHAHATSVQIGLDLGDELVRVSVEDNGSGFELTEALTSPDADRLGLAMMRERIEMLGGRISFDSSVGRGTKVAFELPT
jgi:two-component system sensor histidine kinase DegS